MQALIEILLSNCLLACGLAIAATVLTKCWENPHLAHALWLLVLVKLVTPPLVHLPVSVFPRSSNVTDVPRLQVAETDVRDHPAAQSLPEIIGPPVVHFDERPGDFPATSSESPSVGTSLWKAIGENLPVWMLAGWCTGTIVIMSIAGWRHRHLRRQLSDVRHADATINDEAGRISRQMGLSECPPIRLTAAHICPLVMIGWRQQTVVLPGRLLDQLSREQLRSVIAHELAHIRRSDHWVRLFELVVLAVHWWNPLAWRASRQLRRAEEQCCDAWVVWVLPDGRRSYGQALMRTVEFLTEEKPHAVEANLAFGRSLFQRRIEMILSREMPHRMSRQAAGVMLVLSAIVLPLAARSQDADELGTAAARPDLPQANDGESAKHQSTTEPADFVIEGVCTDSLQIPLAGVRVRLFAAIDRVAPAEQIAEAMSDVEGRFRFDGLIPPANHEQKGKYRMYAVVATHPDHASTIRQLFSPETHDLQMVLPMRGTLSGVVTSEVGDPISGADVYFYGINGHSAPGALSTTTDADGFYEITDMPAFESEMIEVVDPVTRQLVKRPRSSIIARVQHSDYGVLPVSISQVPGTVFIVLKSPAIVEGVVTDAVTGKPAARVRISAQGTDDSEHRGWNETLTDEAGHYRMLLMPDPYNIWASMPGRTVVALDSYLAVAGESPPADLELIEGGFITGRVLDSDGNPVGHTDGRTIRIGLHGPSRPRSGAAVESVAVSDDGTYRMRVPPGENYPYIMSGGVWADRDPTNVGRSKPVIIQEGETQTLDITVHGINKYVGALQRGDEASPLESRPSTSRNDNGGGRVDEKTSSIADAQGGSSDASAADGGSDLLRRIRAAATPILADMAAHHGYSLEPGQSVRRVAPPFPDLRMNYYRVGHPGQAAAIPAGPSAMAFRWEDEQLRNWGMTFGDYSLAGALDALLGIKRQQIEGPPDLLVTRLPGDWVVRTGAAKEDVVEQLATILRDELDLDVRLGFRTVEREVYVATGRYELTPLPGQEGKGKLQLTDETILTDRVQIFGKELVPNSGAGGGTGDFDEFLRWLGRWIDAMVVNEVAEQPRRQISWRLHERSPSTDQSRRETHEAQIVLENITKQTNVRFAKETRLVVLLFVERM